MTTGNCTDKFSSTVKLRLLHTSSVPGNLDCRATPISLFCSIDRLRQLDVPEAPRIEVPIKLKIHGIELIRMLDLDRYLCVNSVWKKALILCEGRGNWIIRCPELLGVYREEQVMDSWVCIVCGYVYDPETGDPDNGVAPGTAWEDVPDDWLCPICGASKDDFEKE